MRIPHLLLVPLCVLSGVQAAPAVSPWEAKDDLGAAFRVMMSQKRDGFCPSCMDLCARRSVMQKNGVDKVLVELARLVVNRFPAKRSRAECPGLCSAELQKWFPYIIQDFVVQILNPDTGLDAEDARRGRIQQYQWQALAQLDGFSCDEDDWAHNRGGPNSPPDFSALTKLPRITELEGHQPPSDGPDGGSKPPNAPPRSVDPSWKGECVARLKKSADPKDRTWIESWCDKQETPRTKQQSLRNPNPKHDKIIPVRPSNTDDGNGNGDDPPKRDNRDTGRAEAPRREPIASNRDSKSAFAIPNERLQPFKGSVRAVKEQAGAMGASISAARALSLDAAARALRQVFLRNWVGGLGIQQGL